MNRSLVTMWAALGLVACADTPSTPVPGPDAGFISADAEPEVDAEVRPDAQVDAGFLDASDPGDAEPLDADPCLAPSAFTLSATEAAAQSEVLAGQLISLTGTATRTGLNCTDRACPEDNPCCNDCTARIRVGDVLLQTSECYTSDLRCAGSECSQTCRPPLFGLPQVFRGVLSTSTPDLELLLYEIR